MYITFFSPKNIINYFIFFLKGGVNHAIIVSNNTTNFEDLFDNEEDDEKDEERLIGTLSNFVYKNKQPTCIYVVYIFSLKSGTSSREGECWFSTFPSKFGVNNGFGGTFHFSSDEGVGF